MKEKNEEEYRNYLKLMSAGDARDITATHANMNLIHFIADFQVFAKEKIDILFHKARHLKLDPNAQDKPWHNTPLMNIIAYEKVEYIPHFLNAAKKNGFDIDLDLQDREGKTALLFAILLGWTPSYIIESLITSTNYNISDRRGLTPVMAACALRRLDVVKLLIEFGLGVSLEKVKRNEAQEAKLQEFLSQRHIDSGKSLVHFAVLRAGVLRDQKKENYIATVLNLLKIAKIDGFRDLKARCNAITLPGLGILTAPEFKKDKLKKNELIFTSIYINNGQETKGQALLSSSDNSLLMNPNSEYYQLFKNIFDTYARQSLVHFIMSGTSDMLDFLVCLGCDLNSQQNNGKTMKLYIEGLTKESPNVTELDTDCFNDLSKNWNKFISSYCCSFFKSYGLEKNASELITSYAGLSPK